MLFGNAKKVIGWTVTIVYGGYLLITTVNEVRGLINDLKEYNKLKRTYPKDKPRENVIETVFVD